MCQRALNWESGAMISSFCNFSDCGHRECLSASVHLSLHICRCQSYLYHITAFITCHYFLTLLGLHLPTEFLPAKPIEYKPYIHLPDTPTP